MKLTYGIKGVHCQSCLEKIRTALAPIAKTIQFTQDPASVTLELNSFMSLTELNSKIAEAGNYQLYLQNIVSANHNHPDHDIKHNEHEQQLTLKSAYPIILITAYIALVSIITHLQPSGIHIMGAMNSFMAGFFLVFSAFKFLNLSGFAEAYANYDLLAAKWKFYGFIYPFIELALGIAYLLQPKSIILNTVTIIVMGFSAIGVINALRQKRKFICACLGTIINVPMSIITLTEDLTMVFMALLMIIFLQN